MFTHLVVEEITPSFCKRWLRLWVCSNWWSSSRPLQEMRCKSCHWTRRFYECRFSLRVDDFRRNLSYIFAIDDLETHANWRFPNHRLKNVSPKQSRDSPGKWLGERIYWAAISHTDQGFWCHTLACRNGSYDGCTISVNSFADDVHTSILTHIFYISQVSNVV